MQLTTNPLASSAEQFMEDDKLVFIGHGGSYLVEPGADGSYYVLRDGGPARDGIVARVFDADTAELIAGQKSRALY